MAKSLAVTTMFISCLDLCIFPLFKYTLYQINSFALIGKWFPLTFIIVVLFLVWNYRVSHHARPIVRAPSWIINLKTLAQCFQVCYAQNHMREIWHCSFNKICLLYKAQSSNMCMFCCILKFLIFLYSVPFQIPNWASFFFSEWNLKYLKKTAKIQPFWKSCVTMLTWIFGNLFTGIGIHHVIWNQETMDLSTQLCAITQFFFSIRYK